MTAKSEPPMSTEVELSPLQATATGRVFGLFKKTIQATLFVGFRAQVIMVTFSLTNFLSSGGFLRVLGVEGFEWILWQHKDLSPSQGSGSGADSSKHSISDNLEVYSGPFFGPIAPKKMNLNWKKLGHEEFVRFLSEEAGPISQEIWRGLSWTSPKRESFQASFRQIQNWISENQVQKAVPIVFSQAEFTVQNLHKLNLIKSLLNSPPDLWPYGQWNWNDGFIGCSPEVLFHLREHEIHTMALAGTSPLDHSDHEFLVDPKERAEHDWVVRNLEENFMAVLAGTSVFKKGPGVLKLPTLKHLITQLSASIPEELKSNRALLMTSLIESLHPSAALGAYPQSFWPNLKLLPEQKDRFVFGSPFGVLEPSGLGTMIVAIRQLQWSETQMRIGAGCGVVAASNFEREWKELLLKINSVHQRFFSDVTIGWGET